MEFKVHSHRFAWQIIHSTPALGVLWEELQDAIAGMTDEALIKEFSRQQGGSTSDLENSEDEEKGSKMSLSTSINHLLDSKLKLEGWQDQSALFQGAEYQVGTRWRLDFSKRVELKPDENGPSETSDISGIAVEVAFNHGEAIAWNLLKPVIAAELNHVEKQTDIGAGVGVIICATEDLKKAGAFDGAVGSYEKFLRYLKPMNNQLTVPMLIIGLEPPKTFKVKKTKDPVTKKNSGTIVKIS